MTKVQVAIGGALGFAIVGWFGFDVQAVEQTEWSLIGLRFSVSWMPTFFVLVAMVFIAMMPLTERHMTNIRRKLSARDRRWPGVLIEGVAGVVQKTNSLTKR